MSDHTIELRQMVFDASYKLSEAQGALEVLGKPDLAKEFKDHAESLRSRLFEMGNDQ